MKKKYEKGIAKNPKLEPELKLKFTESITERTMLRKQRLSEIAKKEMAIDNNLFKEYFEYSRPSNM